MIYYHGYYNFLLFLKYQSKINTSLETRYFYDRSRDRYYEKYRVRRIPERTSI